MKMPKKNDWTKEELQEEYVSKMTAVTIPVNIHVEGLQRILDLAEMKKILEDAELISLGECGCRKDLKKCDAPLDVCISLDKEAANLFGKDLAKRVSLDEAL